MIDDTRTTIIEQVELQERARAALRERYPRLRGIHQTQFGVSISSESPGNCTQAAVATLTGLGLDDVPHFVGLTLGDPRGDAWFHVLDTWSRDRFGIAWLPVEPLSILDQPFSVPRSRVLFLGGGPSPRGPWGHSVVVDANLDLVWDPNPGGEGVVFVDSLNVPVVPEPVGHDNDGSPLYTIVKLPDAALEARS